MYLLEAKERITGRWHRCTTEKEDLESVSTRRQKLLTSLAFCSFYSHVRLIKIEIIEETTC